MKKTLSLAMAVFCVAAGIFAAEDWRGSNRIAGVVVDKATCKGVPHAKLMLRIQKGQKGGPDATADANGKWAVLGIGSGGWNIDVEAPGYVTRQMSFSIAEQQRLPSMKI